MDAPFTFDGAWFTLLQLLHAVLHSDWATIAVKFFPFVLLCELPIQLLVMLGALRRYLEERRSARVPLSYCPKVTCIITCYSEGAAVQQTIRTLTEQLYDGQIEMLAVVDGAVRNRATHAALQALVPYVKATRNRRLEIVAKLQRGGRVSSLNQGLALARGEIVLALDADTSFDNDMVQHAVRHFVNPDVVAVAGNLRVRNARSTLVTRLQAVEYMLSIHLSRAGLDAFNIVNNVSGAFGIFRRDFLCRIGGWDSGTAEDLDLTLRIKKYFARYPRLRIRFEPRAIGHTDAPEGIKAFLKQHMYRHHRVMRVMGEAEGILFDLFARYQTFPGDLPAEWVEGTERESEGERARRIGNFIAGMTDRFALIEHQRLFDSTPDLR